MPVHGVTTNSSNSTPPNANGNMAPPKKTPVTKTTSKTPAKKAQASKKKKNPPPRPTIPTSNQAKNFSLEEDVLLTKAWICISQDPIKGVGQKLAHFWSNIKERYDELICQKGKPDMINQTSHSLMKRWKHNIMRNVNIYLPFIRQVHQEQPSGANIEDMFNTAAERPFHQGCLVHHLQVSRTLPSTILSSNHTVR